MTSGGALMHMQYNSPMPLYSRQAVEEEMIRATGQPSPRCASGQSNVEMSGAFKLVHENDSLKSHHHSARYDEPSSNDVYPHYAGYVDPNVQSPSFKKLQQYAGLGQQKIKTDQNFNQPAYNIDQQNLTNPAQPLKPYYENSPVAQRDPASSNEHDHLLDPTFGDKISEAERPHLPPPIVPDWARKVQDKKQQRLADYEAAVRTQQRDQFQSHGYTTDLPQMTKSYGQTSQLYSHVPNAPKLFSNPPQIPQSYTQISQLLDPADINRQPIFITGNTEGFNTTYGQSHNSQRPHSAEPIQRNRSPLEKKPWLKPYIAPNVLNAKFEHSPDRQRPPSHPKLLSQDYQSFGGIYFGPETRRIENHEKPYADAGDYDLFNQQIQSNCQGYGHAPLTSISGTQRQWSEYDHESEAHKGGRQLPQYPRGINHRHETQNLSEAVQQTVLPLWKNEREAWERKREMENEVGRRQLDMYHPIPNISHSPTRGIQPITHQWQDSTGTKTKSQSSGSYLDSEGAKVNFTREVYTSSEPSAEFSMLNHKENQATEKILEPGVISRHTTNKYYKKSTYTNQTTTTNANPTTMYPTFNDFHHYGKAPAADHYSIGEMSPGLSQF